MLDLFKNLLHTRGVFKNFCLLNMISLDFSSQFTFVVYCAAPSEEESDEGYPGGVIPVGRGLSTMTRPTT